MNTTSKVLELGFARIWLDEEGIVHMIYSPGAMLTIKELRAGTNAARDLCQGKKRPFLVNARGLKSMDRKARMFAVS